MTHPTLLVGCPVWKRGWALPLWFQAIETTAFMAGIEPVYLFASDPRDEDSQSVINRFCEEHNRGLWQVWIEEDDELPAQRHWNHERYARMAYIRNQLLRAVRQLEPDYFLSVDSDIFLHPQALQLMVEHIGEYEAIGGKAYMTPFGTTAPSYAQYNGDLFRPDDSGVFKVDVIMAIKLMTPKAYAVDYVPHDLGEDIGWSMECKKKQVRLGWDGRVANKHAMDPNQVEQVDQRCGY